MGIANLFCPPFRSEKNEIMDDPACEPDALRQNLREIKRLNQLLGTGWAILRHFQKIVKDQNISGKIKVLDLCTGSADIPILLVNWSRKQGIDLEIISLDINPLIIDFAKEQTLNYPEIKVIKADAFDLPYEANSFDFVLCSQAFHHFSDTDCLRLLKVMHNLCSTALIVNDLRRNWFNYYGAKLLGIILKLNYVTRNDAPLSVLRSFTKKDWKSLANRAKLNNFIIEQHFVHSFQLISKKAQDL